MSFEHDPLHPLDAHDAHVVAPITGVAELDGIASLMARFTNGQAHELCRRVVVEVLAKVDAVALRLDANRRSDAALAVDTDPDITAVARRVIVDSLSSAMGFPEGDETVDAVFVVAAALAPRADRAAPEAGAVRLAVARLEASAPAEDEIARANLVGALFQAIDATAGLVTNTLRRADTDRTDPRDVERLVDESLASDPPVRCTRRLMATTGETVVVPLTGVGLAFGAGAHECPGQLQARALVLGIVQSVLTAGGVSSELPVYEDRWNLRVVDQQRLRPR